MNILLTGAFGNIGISTLKALTGRGHRIRCFDLPCRTNRRLALKHASDMEVVWGDVRRIENLQRAVQDQDLVINLAALISELSHTGQNSEQHPALAQAVNVGGMRNLLQVLKAMFQVPLHNRIEFVHTLNVGMALAHAVDQDLLWGKHHCLPSFSAQWTTTLIGLIRPKASSCCTTSKALMPTMSAT